MYYFKTDGLFEFKETIRPCAILVCNDLLVLSVCSNITHIASQQKSHVSD